MSVDQLTLTRSLLDPVVLALNSGTHLGVAPLFNAAIGVMQPAGQGSIDSQYYAALHISRDLGFWLADCKSGSDQLSHFEKVVQPLFLRGFNTSGVVADMAADALFRRVGGQIDRDGKLAERRLRPFGEILDSGILGINVYAGLQSGVLVSGHSTVLHGAHMMMRAIDDGAFPWYWSSKKRDALKETVKSFIDEETRSYSIDDRTLANIGIWRKSTQSLFDMRSLDPDFGIAALREDFLRGQKTDPVALPIFALSRSSQLFSIPEATVPFIVVGPQKEIRFLLPDKRFDSYTDFISGSAALAVLGVVVPVKAMKNGKPWAGVISGNETLLASGSMRRERDRIVLQEVNEGTALTHVLDAFERLHNTIPISVGMNID